MDPILNHMLIFKQTKNKNSHDDDINKTIVSKIAL